MRARRVATPDVASLVGLRLALQRLPDDRGDLLDQLLLQRCNTMILILLVVFGVGSIGS